MGGRFRSGARQRLGQLDEIEPGLWRSQVLQHLVFLVDSETFASEPDSVPLHLLFERAPEQERELGNLVVEQPYFLEWYGSWLSFIHPELWREVRQMARVKQKGLEFDFTGIKEDMTPANQRKMLESLGVDRILELLGPKKMIDAKGVDWFLSNLSPAELKKLKERLK